MSPTTSVTPFREPTSFDDWVTKLFPDAVPTGDGFLVPCVAHADDDPSLKLDVSETGAALAYCFGGCGSDDVLARLDDLATLVGAPDYHGPFKANGAARVAKKRDPVPIDERRRALDTAAPHVAALAAAAREDDPRVTAFMARFGLDADTAEALHLWLRDDRVWIPLFRLDGTLATAQGRALDPDAPRWWNILPEDRDAHAWDSVGFVSRERHEDRPVMIVEGLSDALAVARLDEFDVLAVAGASNARHVAQFAQYLDGRAVYVAGDGDPSGIRFNAAVAEAVPGVRALTIPEGRDLADLCADDPSRFSDTLARLIDDAPEANRYARIALTRSGLANLPEPEPLIADTLDRDTDALLAGYHGTGKSFVALDWAACVATGAPWQGREARKGRTLYVVGEGAHGIHQRLHAWETHRGIAIPDKDFVVIPEAVQLADTVNAREFIDYVKAERFDLIVIDTVARSAVGLDENSAKDMGVFIDAAANVRRASPRSCVLLVHHTGKDARTVRGSSALEAAMDTVYMTDGDASTLTLKRTKRKDGPAEDVHALRLANVAGSCVVESADEGTDEGDFSPELRKAYLAILVAHGTAAETRSVLVTTLQDAGFGRSVAYKHLTRLHEMDVLRNAAPDAKVVRLAIDKATAAAVGFPTRSSPIALTEK